jgi:2-oxo-4-hydroxy-4-carboxy-5-ureidoimidazoline decarboxylase
MSGVLARWNSMPRGKAVEEILPCCGSRAWARAMAARRPIRTAVDLLAACDAIWKDLPVSDWIEAFQSHPRIGESKAPSAASAQSTAWSSTEQQKVGTAGDAVKAALAEGNRAYEQRFGRILIVCATGKSAQEILEILERRLRNDDRTELLEAAEQQRQIAHLRLKKWLNS